MNLHSTIEIYAGGPGSGCKGPTCGRKAVYHGTSFESAKKILKEGLIPHSSQNDAEGGEKRVFATESKDSAFIFARSASRNWNADADKAALVVIKNPVKAGFNNGFLGDLGYWTTKKRVSPENIDRIEVYSMKDLHNSMKPKPLTILRPKGSGIKAATGEVYVVVPL